MEDRLAEMAGIGGMKAEPGGERRRSGSSSSESDGYDSESGRVLQYQSVKVRELLMMLHVDVAFFCILCI